VARLLPVQRPERDVDVQRSRRPVPRLAVLKLPEHSTILVPAYHQGVEIDTLLAAGYQVRYYRVDERLLVDFEDLERRLDRAVSALYVIHYFGCRSSAFARPTGSGWLGTARCRCSAG